MEIIRAGKREKLYTNLLRKLFEKPVSASIIIMIGAIACTYIPLSSLLENIYGSQAAEYLAAIIEQGLVSVILIVGLKNIGLFEMAGFKCKAKSLWVIWPMVLFLLLIIVEHLEGGQKIDWQRPMIVILFVLSYLSTGLFEEILCRGIVFNLMFKKWGKTKDGCYLALLLSSILFGASHFIHFILGQTDIIATLAQVGYATFFGAFFCACYVRNKNIYPAIILHGFVDIICDLDEIVVGGGIDKSYKTMSANQGSILVLFTLPFLLYALWCVRKEFAKSMIVENNKLK